MYLSITGPSHVTPDEAAGTPAPAVHVLCEPAIEAATVLIVEDDGHCRLGLRRQLLRAGFEVCEAANGLEALHLLNRRRVDVLATDIRMPTMSGLALVEALANDHPDLPIVAFSGALLVDPGIHARLAARHVPLLVKPFPPEAFIAAVREALGMPGQAA
jgi:CheY-like chemotaxis protein